MKVTGLYPSARVDVAPVSAVGQAGGVLLTETLRVSGLDRALSMGLAAWRKPLATHDPGKIVTDLAVALALGGDSLSDVVVLRGEPGVYGLAASDPTVLRAITALAGDADTSIAAISSGRGAGCCVSGWRACSRRGCDGRGAAGHQSRRDVDHRALVEGAGRVDLQARVRVSSALRVP